MEPDEIRAEIERRKKRAIDLKLRETLWTLYKSHLRWYAEKLKKDPEMIYPEIRETLGISDTQFQFRVGGTAYKVLYNEGKQETDSWGSRSRNDETTTTPITLTLHIDGHQVFDFKMKTTVECTRDMPIFHEYMGEVTAFIEGTWVTGLVELLQKIRQYEGLVREKRQAPGREQKLREDMKRFGL